MNVNFNLKEPNKSSSLILMFCRWNGNYIKLSTRHSIECKTWNKEKQKCRISKAKFSEESNTNSAKVNTFLDSLRESANNYFDSSNFNIKTTAIQSVRESLEQIIDTLVCAEKKQIENLRQTPIEFFKTYIERKRIDSHTGRYIGERTKIHQRTVIHRLESFIEDTNLPNDFSTFASKRLMHSLQNGVIPQIRNLI